MTTRPRHHTTRLRPDLAHEDPAPYTRPVTAKPTIDETQQLIARSVLPATVAARFALVVALVAFVVSAVAVAVAVRP